MEYTLEILRLSSQFNKDYPKDTYPELMHKQGRPYTCLLIDLHCDYFICIPFRSSIKHKNAFMFTGTERSKRTHSGLDYSKKAIIKNTDYFDRDTPAVVDQDEYNEMITNKQTIVNDADSYVSTYINHITGTKLLHPRAFSRKYQYSTLPYFHDIMGI